MRPVYAFDNGNPRVVASVWQAGTKSSLPTIDRAFLGPQGTPFFLRKLLSNRGSQMTTSRVEFWAMSYGRDVWMSDGCWDKRPASKGAFPPGCPTTKASAFLVQQPFGDRGPFPASGTPIPHRSNRFDWEGRGEDPQLRSSHQQPFPPPCV